jgi:hypothetical protein
MAHLWGPTRLLKEKTFSQPAWLLGQCRPLMLFAGGALLLLVAGRPASSGPLPLPPEEQEQVNHAIDRGVAFLKATQDRRGTWAARGAPHQVGYAALPGLTLLECGVPPNDPVIQRTAGAIRRTAGMLDATYEISLAILFLDRLGDPKDKPVIERLAVRLIASQAPTGGWGYKCHSVSPAKQRQILVLLRQLDPPADLPLMVQGPSGKAAELAGGPVGQPPAGPGGGAVRRGDGMPGMAQRGDGVLEGGVAAPGPTDPLRAGTTSSLNPPSGGSQLDSPPSAGPTAGPAPAGRMPELGPRADGRAPADRMPQPGKRAGRPAPSFPSNQWARCIKSDTPPDDAPAPAAPAERRAEARAAAKAPAGKVVIPPGLGQLTVFRPPDWLGLLDPPGRDQQPLLPTTDNSNSQFAVLALWAAQRHGVPVERTLRRIALRYETSQNGDGSWGYHYRRGGGESERPAMTCVGLLGLAVGHGIDRAPAVRAVQNPRVLGGFVALNKHVGKPAGRTQGLPMTNLYFLWSVERVAVLYDLQTIGGKDWYRWGAEILLANQQPLGNWANGGYHAASPVIDTSLALLFLKRANLAADLTARLPFDPIALDNSVVLKVAEANRFRETGDEARVKVPPAEPKPPEPPAPPELAGGAFAQTNEHAASNRASDENSAWGREEAPRHGRWPYFLLGLGVLLLIGAIVFVIMYHMTKNQREEEEQPVVRRPKRRSKLGASGVG